MLKFSNSRTLILNDFEAEKIRLTFPHMIAAVEAEMERLSVVYRENEKTDRDAAQRAAREINILVTARSYAQEIANHCAPDRS